MYPSLHEEMTIYSLVAVAQRWRSDSRAETTSLALFGHSGAGLRHDFPSHLEYFATITGGAYGSPLELALKHTVLPYFTVFRPLDILVQSVATMGGPSVERLKYSLGLPASHMGASFPLRYCPACRSQDEELIGYAYWHRIHQIPGIHVCPIHQEIVFQTRIRINGMGRTRLVLPADDDICAETVGLNLTPAARDLLRRLAALSQCALTSCLPRLYDPHLLHECYRFGLAQQGWLSAAGSIRATGFVKAISDHFRPVSHIGPFDRLVSGACAESMLSLVRKPRKNATTLAHLLLIEFLFGDWNRFASAYQWQNQLALPFAEPPSEAVSNNDLVGIKLANSLRCIADAYRNGDGSLSALCRRFGVALDTAMRWLGRLGLADIARRPRVVTTDIRSQAEALLKEGRTQKDVCAFLSLSKATVDRILNASPSLHASWQQARHARRREIERNRLARFIEAHPKISIKDLRAVPGTGYSWLSGHDRAWLRTQVPKVARKPNRESQRRLRVDWSSRDQQCLLALQTVAANLDLAQSEIIKPPAILRRLSALPFKPQLARLPLSKHFLDELLVLHRALRSGNTSKKLEL